VSRGGVKGSCLLILGTKGADLKILILESCTISMHAGSETNGTFTCQTFRIYVSNFHRSKNPESVNRPCPGRNTSQSCWSLVQNHLLMNLILKPFVQSRHT